jgi:hypothetical protein
MVKSGKVRLEHFLSAIPLKADFARSLRAVSFAPQEDICTAAKDIFVR